MVKRIACLCVIVFILYLKDFTGDSMNSDISQLDTHVFYSTL